MSKDNQSWILLRQNCCKNRRHERGKWGIDVWDVAGKNILDWRLISNQVEENVTF